MFDVDPIEIWEAHQAGDDRSHEIEVFYEFSIRTFRCNASHLSVVTG